MDNFQVAALRRLVISQNAAYALFRGAAGSASSVVVGCTDPAKATPAELRGQDIFFGKGECALCHQPPFYTDNLMHDLRTERFFKPVMINNMMEVGDGAIKTFALRGVKDNPPYLHDERLLTLEDTVEFFNLILGTKLQPQEKQDLVAFLRTL
jgi:cytochrome c peroxidase